MRAALQICLGLVLRICISLVLQHGFCFPLYPDCGHIA